MCPSRMRNIILSVKWCVNLECSYDGVDSKSRCLNKGTLKSFTRVLPYDVLGNCNLGGVPLY